MLSPDNYETPCILTKAQKQMQEATLANNLSIQFVQNGASEVEQVRFTMENLIQPKLNEFNEKTNLMRQLMQLRRAHINQWDVFIADKSPIVQMLDKGGYLNVSAEEIRHIINLFDQYLKSLPPPPPQEYNNNNNSFFGSS